MRKKNIHITLIIALIFLTFFPGLFYISRSLIRPSNSEKLTENYSPKIVTHKKTATPTITPSPTQIPTPTPPTFKGLPVEKFYITFYDWPDNTPPGNAIAFPSHLNPVTIHNTTGGIGTYSDPITFASDPEYINPGTIYYVPYLGKYIMMEDLCVTCVKNWNNSIKHIDVWMDSDNNFREELINCQNKWTRIEAYVVTKPTGNLPTELTPIFNKESGDCLVNNYNNN